MGKLKIISGLLLVVFIMVTLNGICAADDRWWKKDKEGWFFYKEPLFPEEQDKEKKEEEVIPKEVVRESVPQSPKENKKLFTEQLKEKGHELLSAAMQYPIPENIQNYIRWNKFMMDISSNFAVAWQKELMRSPSLRYDIPMVDTTKDIYFVENRKDEDKTVQEIAGRAGLFYFYRTTCPFCKRQVRYLKEFADRYGFIVKAVSLDGGVYPEFQDALMDNGISIRLGVDQVPSIFLAFPDEDRFERLSSSLVTSAELKQRVLYYAKKVNNNFDISNYIN
jgi:conjugal transfer pilus assembly protein TraF